MHILAYIDPGSGSLLLQAIVAGLLAIPFFFRRTIGDFMHRIRGGSQPAEKPDAPGPDGSEELPR
jgi:hypothetical protein